LIVAVIGLLGTLGAATIANWDKIAGRPKEPSPKHLVSDDEDPPSPTINKKKRAIDVTGTWRDPNYPSNYSRITQDEENIRFDGAGATIQGIGFRTSGAGTLSGLSLSLEYATVYQTGQQAQGTCSGTVSSSASQMTLRCTDPLFGKFVLSSVKD
jgi:hypothetical protein